MKSNNHQVKDQLLCKATEAYHLIIIRSTRFYFRSTSSYPAGLIIVSSLGSRDHSATTRRCDHFLQLWWLKFSQGYKREKMIAGVPATRDITFCFSFFKNYISFQFNVTAETNHFYFFVPSPFSIEWVVQLRDGGQ